ncbi:MAG: GxxExxY protein [Pirellulales bacterium]
MIEPIPAAAETIGTRLLDAAFEVHRRLGPGLLESVYEVCVCHELTKLGLPFQRQVWLPINYDEIQIDAGLRLDIVLQDIVIAEIKAVETILPVHDAQLLTYLKLTGMRLGFLINFNVPLLKNGIKRIVL